MVFIAYVVIQVFEGCTSLIFAMASSIYSLTHTGGTHTILQFSSATSIVVPIPSSLISVYSTTS